MQVSLQGVSRRRMRDFCHKADVPGVLFSFNDDLWDALRHTKRLRKCRRCVPLCKTLRSTEGEFKAS